MSQKMGRIAQVIGAVIDVCFDADDADGKVFLPAIYEALKVEAPDGRELILEVQQHIGDDTVRAVAMDRMVQKMAVSTLENRLFHRLI